MIAESHHRQILSGVVTLRIRHVRRIGRSTGDGGRQVRVRSVGDDVSTSPLEVVRGDDKLDAPIARCEVRHRRAEVLDAGRRVAEFDLVGVEDVAPADVDADARELEASPRWRSNVGEELVGGPDDLWSEAQDIAPEESTDALCIAPALEEAGEKDGAVRRGGKVGTCQLLDAFVERERARLAEIVAGTEVDAGRRTVDAVEREHVLDDETVGEVENSRSSVGEIGDEDDRRQVEQLVAETATVGKTAGEADVAAWIYQRFRLRWRRSRSYFCLSSSCSCSIVIVVAGDLVASTEYCRTVSRRRIKVLTTGSQVMEERQAGKKRHKTEYGNDTTSATQASREATRGDAFR